MENGFITNSITKLLNMEGRSIALFCALCAALLFLPSLLFDFTYDDFHQIHKHTLVTAQEISFDTLFFPFFEPTFPGDLYRPLTIFSYRLTYIFFGLNPFWFHLLNIVLHSIISGLVFVLASRITKNTAISLFSSLWFALHPIHVEAAASIVGRAELLAALFALSTIFLFDKTVSLSKANQRLGWLLATCAVFIASLMSKESAITLLPLIPICSLLMLDITKYGYESRKWRVLLVFFALLAAAMFYLFLRKTILTDLFLPNSSEGIFWVENPLLKAPLLDRLIPGVIILGQYLMLLLFPIRLTADYSATFDAYWDNIFSASGALAIAIALGFIVLLYQLRKEKFSFFGLWTLAAISIALNIAVPIGTLFAERLAYLPSIGFCIFASFAFMKISQTLNLRKSLVYLIAALVLSFCLLRSSIRIPVWKNNETLFLTTLSDSPGSPKAKINLGLHRYQQKRYLESSHLFKAAAIEDPERSFPYPYLVNSLLFQGKIDEAEAWCKKALQINPNDKQIAEALRRIISYKNDLALSEGA